MTVIAAVLLGVLLVTAMVQTRRITTERARRSLAIRRSFGPAFELQERDARRGER